MKVLVLNGSPKAKSDTMQLTQAFLKGMKNVSEHDIEIIDIIKHNIKPCIGCFECWRTLDGRCVIKDFQNEILAKMQAADCIIWSFPLYCCGMPSHVKAVLDRTLPFSKIRFGGSNEEPKYGENIFSSKKRCIVICGSGFPVNVVNFEALKIQCIHMFGRVRMICVNQTPLLNVPSAKEHADKLLKKFEAAGEEFATRTYLYKETLDSLQTPMLSNEDYLKVAAEVGGN
ncbi:MAG: flavodoxin family protein [Clostridiales bacterium]|nr:flavodoxin family protein [Clostridiales bacterium]